MIIEAEIIDQPYSGQYEERIYDISSPWNSQNWTWVKFLNDDFIEWCGEFRGLPRNVAISKKYNHEIYGITIEQLRDIEKRIFQYIRES